MLHVKSALLRGTALDLRPAPERKDDDPNALGAEVKKAVADLSKTIEEFRTKNDERLKQIEKKGEDAVTKVEIERINAAIDAAAKKVNDEIKTRVDDIEAKANRLALGGTTSEGQQLTPEQVEYSKKFEDYMRTGYGEQKGTADYRELKDLEKKATAASTDNDPSGGYTVRPQIDNQIDAVLKEISPIRSIASVMTIGTGSFKKLVNQHGASSGWVGERESRVQTLSPDLAELEYPVFEIYAMPAATQNLLDDSYINIDQWLVDEIDLEFAQQEGAAFINGNGVKKPRGILGGYSIVADASYAWGSLGYVATGNSGAFAASNPADSLLSLVFAIKKGYRANASIVMNRSTMAAVRKLKDGQGNYLVDLRLRDNALVETIFGFPVTEAEDMPTIAANSYSIAFGDFKRGYLIIDRQGTRVLRDPYTAKPYVLFYTTKRVGGGVQNFEAIKLLKFAAS
jgi:HK97 family phage major capsid protein